MLPRYNTAIWTDIFPDFDTFKSVFDNDFGSYAKDCITAANLKSLYYLLYARYGANPFINYSTDLIKAKVVAITYQKGPTWEKRKSVQDQLRGLTEAELLKGSSTVFNRASHPEQEPSTDTDEYLTYLNAQDVSKIKRSKLDAYSYLQDVLKTDVTEEFLKAYSVLFSKVVTPHIERVYEDEVLED
jgi:hypothetical protein